MVTSIIVLHTHKQSNSVYPVPYYFTDWEIFETANNFRIDDGILYIYNDETENVIQVFAPGTWLEVFVAREDKEV